MCPYIARDGFCHHANWGGISLSNASAFLICNFSRSSGDTGNFLGSDGCQVVAEGINPKTECDRRKGHERLPKCRFCAQPAGRYPHLFHVARPHCDRMGAAVAARPARPDPSLSADMRPYERSKFQAPGEATHPTARDAGWDVHFSVASPPSNVDMMSSPGSPSLEGWAKAAKHSGSAEIILRHPVR